jgi:inorganic pyrophosphatase
MARNVEARIEIPMGSRNKYEVEHGTGKIKLDRVLYSAVFYPAEYGYVENTLSLDGDPLDILVFTSSPTFPGCYIEARIIGGLYMIDCGQEDVKILSVCTGDPRYDHVQELGDLSPHYLREISTFFATYKQLQHAETVVKNYFDADTACRYLDEARERYRQSGAAPV